MAESDAIRQPASQGASASIQSVTRNQPAVPLRGTRSNCTASATPPATQYAGCTRPLVRRSCTMERAPPRQFHILREPHAPSRNGETDRGADRSTTGAAQEPSNRRDLRGGAVAAIDRLTRDPTYQPGSCSRGR